MEKIQDYCNELIEELDLSSNGHLKLSDIVKLMKMVGNPILISKILFECTKKVYPIWEKDYPNDSI